MSILSQKNEELLNAIEIMDRADYIDVIGTTEEFEVFLTDTSMGSKEEYAEFYYLLSKLKFHYGIATRKVYENPIEDMEKICGYLNKALSLNELEKYVLLLGEVYQNSHMIEQGDRILEEFAARNGLTPKVCKRLAIDYFLWRSDEVKGPYYFHELFKLEPDNYDNYWEYYDDLLEAAVEVPSLLDDLKMCFDKMNELSMTPVYYNKRRGFYTRCFEMADTCLEAGDAKACLEYLNKSDKHYHKDQKAVSLRKRACEQLGIPYTEEQVKTKNVFWIYYMEKKNNVILSALQEAFGIAKSNDEDLFLSGKDVELEMEFMPEDVIKQEKEEVLSHFSLVTTIHNEVKENVLEYVKKAKKLMRVSVIPKDPGQLHYQTINVTLTIKEALKEVDGILLLEERTAFENAESQIIFDDDGYSMVDQFGVKNNGEEAEPEKDLSYMMVIPYSVEEIRDVKHVVERLYACSDIRLIEDHFDEGVKMTVEIREKIYHITFYPRQVEIPDMVREQNRLLPEEVEIVRSASAGLMVEMEFGDNIFASYHAQLMILNALVEKPAAVLDFSAELLLSGKWLSLAATSAVPPAPHYLFCGQGILNEEGRKVWLHTHGLNRCGLPELEILNADEDTWSPYGNLLDMVASRMISEEQALIEEAPFYIARLSNGQPLMITLIPWQKALEKEGELSIGGSKDRNEGHDGYSDALYFYKTPSDHQNGNFSHLSEVAELLDDNPMYMISNRETERMRALAIERLDYVKEAFKREDAFILLKMGCRVDDPDEAGTEFEHCWFKVLDIKGDEAMVELTHDTYYIKDMYQGGIYTLPLSTVTDWYIYIENEQERARYSPDQVYLL